MIELLAIGIAVAIGWGIAHGLAAHMEPEPGVKPGGAGDALPPLPPPATPEMTLPKSCNDYFNELPTGGSDIDNLRNAVLKMYAVASTAEDADTLDKTADGLDTIGHHEAAVCLRKRAAKIRAAGGGTPSGATTSPVSSTVTAGNGFVFPTS